MNLMSCAWCFGLLLAAAHVNPFIPQASACSTNSALVWEQMPVQDQADLLQSLEYTNGNELPLNTKKIEYAQTGKAFSIKAIRNPVHRQFVAKAIATFEDQVSREEIEQSHFSTFGSEVFTGVDLLVSCDESVVLGANLSAYQDGRNEDGEAQDINWTASIRFNGRAEVLVKPDGTPFDSLSFEWTGH